MGEFLLPPGTAMYLMMIFLAVAVIGVIMAIKNRIAQNRLEGLVNDDTKLRAEMSKIKKKLNTPQREDLTKDMPKGWDNTTIDLGKGKGEVWGQVKAKSKQSEESIEKLMDKLKDEDKDKDD